MTQFQTKPIEEWIAQAKSTLKQYIFYQGYCLDITQFKFIHPGGAQVIKNYLFKDVTHILFTVFPHNQNTTPKLLQKYRIGMLSQRPAPRVRMEGTILKQRNNQRENSFLKKSVQFPSEVKKLASEKERKQEMKRSRKNSRIKVKQSITIKPNTAQTSQQKKSKRTKNINQDYLSALKGSKAPIKPTKSQSSIGPDIVDQIKQQQVTIKKFDSGEIQNVQQSTVNVSIKKHLEKSWGTLQQFLEETIPVIKVPVLNVRLNRIW